MLLGTSQCSRYVLIDKVLIDGCGVVFGRLPRDVVWTLTASLLCKRHWQGGVKLGILPKLTLGQTQYGSVYRYLGTSVCTTFLSTAEWMFQHLGASRFPQPYISAFSSLSPGCDGSGQDLAYHAIYRHLQIKIVLSQCSVGVAVVSCGPHVSPMFPPMFPNND